MNILIVYDRKIPALKYGGTERVIWYLGQELVKKKHQLTFLVPRGSWCPFARVVEYNPALSISEQIPRGTDLVNFHFQPAEEVDFPFLVTIHGNLPRETEFFTNTHFVSQNHARRYGSDAYIYNGLNWDDYGQPDFRANKSYVHFLGKAAWKVKNVRGAIQIAHRNKTEIKILGGSRINFKMGPRVTFSRYATFHGMVGGEEKNQLLRHSKALLFPVLWHEPFGLSVIESLYFGCPVLGTSYGSLPELVPHETGILSDSMEVLSEMLKYVGSFNRRRCHEYARDNFNSAIMAQKYLEYYEAVMNIRPINVKPPEGIPAAGFQFP